jgi:homoserine kinase type II
MQGTERQGTEMKDAAVQDTERQSLNELLGAWSLGELHALTRASGGATHRVYRVESDRGVAFLRVYKRPDPALVAREHALIAHVQRHGIPAPALLVAGHGGTVVEHSGQLAALYAPARGRQLPGTELGLEHAQAAGAQLGALHRALEPLRDAGYVRWTLSWDAAAWVERLNVVERALLARASTRHRSPRDAFELDTDRWALERLRAQRRWLADAACTHSYTPRSPAQVVHGDYQNANLFFDHDSSASATTLSGIIDWDQAAYLPKGYEIARACSFMFQLDPERTERFIAAYRSTSGLDDDALHDGAHAWGAFSDHHVWPLEEVYLNGNDGARRYIPHAPFQPFTKAWQRVHGT